MNALYRYTGAAAIALLAASCQREGTPPPPRTSVVEMINTPVRVTMAALHQSGGVPPGWQLTLPRGDPDSGRELFVLYGCQTCHIVQGEEFSAEPLAPGPVGPELTGMGTHHPAAYFVESILNPDAIVVEGEGYTGADQLSNMPVYPDLTAEHLTDLVAYLTSLTDGDAHAHHAGGAAFSGRVDVAAVPAEESAPASTTPAASTATAVAFFVQTYSVREGKLPALEQWFAAEGLPAFRSFSDLLDVETHVDRTRGPESLVTVFSFSHMEYLRAFLADRRVGESIEKFDEFAEVIDRQIYETRPLYRVDALSAE